jgi:hypothetical protein
MCISVCNPGGIETPIQSGGREAAVNAEDRQFHHMIALLLQCMCPHEKLNSSVEVSLQVTIYFRSVILP